jgi:4-amino-4-deoxy-L-arabinose transferase-like glycosyltransferase
VRHSPARRSALVGPGRMTVPVAPARTPARELFWPSSERLVVLAPLAAITALAAGLRVHGISAYSLWLDEIDEGTTASVALPEFFARVRHDAAAAPLDYLGVKLMTTVLGHGTVATRLWALLLGIAAVPLIYAAARRLFDSRAAALTAAFLLSLSAFHIYYSQEARFYALAVVATLLNVLAFAWALETNGARRWLAYAATCAVALYSYYFVAILFPLEGLYVAGVAVWLLARSRGRQWVAALVTVVGCAAAQALAAVAFVPWIVYAIAQELRVNWPPMQDLTTIRLLKVYTDLIGLAWEWSTASPDETAMTICILVLALVGLVAGAARRRFLVLPLAAAAIVAIPVEWRADQLTHYFFADRQAIVVLPLVLLLAAGGFVECVRLLSIALGRVLALGGPRAAGLPLEGHHVRAAALGLGAGLAALWIIVSAPSIGRVYANGWEVKEDWRGATIFVSANLCPATTLRTDLQVEYSYGIAYYNPLLVPRIHPIPEVPADIERAVIRSGLTPDDWIVLHPATEGGGDQAALDLFLVKRGWQPSVFRGVTVFHGPICPLRR